MLMLRPLGNRQFSRVPYGTAQSEQATAASQWAKAHIDRNAGRVYTRQDSARSSWRAIGPRTSSANTRRRGIWVERRDTKWRTRPALLCTSSLVRWKSEKRRVEGTFGKKKKKRKHDAVLEIHDRQCEGGQQTNTSHFSKTTPGAKTTH